MRATIRHQAHMDARSAPQRIMHINPVHRRFRAERKNFRIQPTDRSTGLQLEFDVEDPGVFTTPWWPAAPTARATTLEERSTFRGPTSRILRMDCAALVVSARGRFWRN